MGIYVRNIRFHPSDSRFLQNRRYWTKWCWNKPIVDDLKKNHPFLSKTLWTGRVPYVGFTPCSPCCVLCCFVAMVTYPARVGKYSRFIFVVTFSFSSVNNFRDSKPWSPDNFKRNYVITIKLDSMHAWHLLTVQLPHRTWAKLYLIRRNFRAC